MRTLSTEQAAAVAGPVTEPQYLVEITLDSPRFLSTRATVILSGNTYTTGDLQVGPVRHDSAELMIANHDDSLTAGAEDGAFLRQPVKILWAYGAATGDASEPVPITRFEGIISATPEIGEWIKVECSPTPPKLYPFQRLRPPTANFLPSAGYVLAWDGAVLRIEG